MQKIIMPNGRRSSVLRTLLTCERGANAVTYALLAVPLMMAIGVGVDGAAMFTGKARLQAATDSAALAMGAQPTGATTDSIKATGQKFFTANFTNSGSLTSGTLSTTFGSNNTVITAVGTATFKPSFSAFLGISSMDISATAEVTREVTGVELALVLDNTGSMWTSNNIEALKAASKNITDIMFGTYTTTAHPNLRVAIVPWVTAVNAGVTLSDGQVLASKLVSFTGMTEVTALDYTGASTQYVPFSATANEQTTSKTLVTDGQTYMVPSDNAKTASGWAGCLIERTSPTDPTTASGRDIDDSTPDVGGYWKQFYWKYVSSDNKWRKTTTTKTNCNKWGNNCTETTTTDLDIDRTGWTDTDNRGPNLACPSPMTPLTSLKTEVTAAIDKITSWRRGGTVGAPGLAWGYRMLSPNFTVLPSDQRGKAWNADGWKKVIVFMTDGDTNVQSNDLTGYGYPNENRMDNTSDGSDTPEGWVNKRISTLCSNLKAADKGVTIFTVVFTSGINDTTKQIYQDCASDTSKYFYAPSQDDLKASFTTIGNVLSNLRLSK